MPICEHFLYALFPDIGYKLYKSSGFNNLVTRDTMHYLTHLGDSTITETVQQLWFPDEQILAVSYLNPVKDKYGRKGTWNHTIIMRINDYLQISQPSTLLNPHLIRSLKEPPESLKPIQVS